MQFYDFIFTYIFLLCITNKELSSNSSSSGTNLVLSGAAYNNFVDTIKSDQTREQYKRCLVRFMRFLNITDIDNLMILAGRGGGAGQNSKALQQKIGANALNIYLSPIMHFYAMTLALLHFYAKRYGVMYQKI